MHKITFEGEDYEWQNGIYMKKVRVMEKGMSFGELALTVGGPRSATIKCGDTDCEFATLDKEAFLKSMENINLKRLNNEIEFFFSISIFAKMSRKMVRKYLNFMKKRKFIRGQILYKEGDQANNVYFVKKGTFEQIKKLPCKISDFRVQRDILDG